VVERLYQNDHAVSNIWETLMTERSSPLKPIMAAFCLLCLVSVTAASVPTAADDWPTIAVRIAASTAPERERIVSLGYAVEAADDEGVWVAVSEGGLGRLRRLGTRVLAVEPLDFPIDDEDYHTPEEMINEILQAQVDHPEIVSVESIGQSLEGRDIYAAKISDNVSLDEPEPEVLLIALTHAREHLTVEQALDLVAHFSDEYGVRGDVTNLVNQREIWIVTQANPDGDEYDRLGDGYYRSWRKNRRDNGDGSWGVDLNRNYGYKWGYDEYGSSSWPSSDTFRGTDPFSEPETVVIRDFVEQHPDIATAISFHSYGELILWPFGYTYERLPEDMAPNDLLVFEQMGQAMAEMNGYKARQASELYRTNGDTTDWLYGEHRVFGFTFEMYPVGSTPGFYPSGDVIREETERNRQAVVYLAGVADNPLKLVGIGGDATSPEARITCPLPDQEYQSQVYLCATASDDVGVTLVEFRVNGQSVGLDDTEPFTLSLPGLESGIHFASAVAYDSGQNRGITEVVPFEVIATGSPTVTPTMTASPTPTSTPTPQPPLPTDHYFPLVFPGMAK